LFLDESRRPRLKHFLFIVQGKIHNITCLVYKKHSALLKKHSRNRDCARQKTDGNLPLASGEIYRHKLL
jgi:hypothetical protein